MNAPPLIRPLRQIVPSRVLAHPRAAHDVVKVTSQARKASTAVATSRSKSVAPVEPNKQPRLPRPIQLLYLSPLRRHCEYGVPSADLQLRSYSVRSLEFFCDFALRAAYYLNLPAFGPVPLPRITERWTVPKSSFIFKKSQENFERITCRRLIQIRDGHPDAVQAWLAFLQKHAYPGVGMKANMWEFSSTEVGKMMDEAAEVVGKEMGQRWAHFGEGKRSDLGTKEKVEERLARMRLEMTGGV